MRTISTILSNNKPRKLPYHTVLILLLFIFPSPAFALSDLQTILENLRSVLDPLMTLLLIISYTAGLGMMFRGLGLLRQFGMPLTQATRPGEIAGPIVYLIVGAVLVYLPTTTNVITRTIFGSDATSLVSAGAINLSALGKASDKILGYAPVAIEGQWANLVDTIILYVQFIGFLAFIRGWFIIAQAGQPSTQPGSVSKGVTHIIGGILAVNFLPMMDILHNTVFGS